MLAKAKRKDCQQYRLKMGIHLLIPRSKPPLRIELICIFTKDLFVTVNDIWVRADGDTFVDKLPSNLPTSPRNLARQTGRSSRMYPHALSTNGVKVRQLDGIAILNILSGKQPGCNRVVEFILYLFEILWALEQVVEDGAERDARRITPGESGSTISHRSAGGKQLRATRVGGRTTKLTSG